MNLEERGNKEGLRDLLRRKSMESATHKTSSEIEGSKSFIASNLEESCRAQGLQKVETGSGQKHMGTSSNSKPSPKQENSVTSKEDEELESAKAEMGEVRLENERLKTMLEQIEKDYRSLQARFFDILDHQVAKNNPNNSNTTALDREEINEPELVSLRLGRSASCATPSERDKKDVITTGNSCSNGREDEPSLKEALTLGLDFNYEVTKPPTDSDPSTENSLGEANKEEGAGETWPPSKIPKTVVRNGDDDISQQSQVKRARVSVRARCDTPTMNDGCQWRKYGQKIAKGNPCPRAYYRCTVAPACPVRKQVQRCADDMSILITTYEGTHNHPLPIAATAMASTTSAAISMLNAGSSTSQAGLNSSAPAAPSGPDFHGLPHLSSLVDSSRTGHLYSLNSSASSPGFPTITLDLTAAPSSSSSSTPFNRFSTSFLSAPRFPSTSLNFSSSDSSNMVPAVWGNGYPGQGTLPYPSTKHQIGSLSIGRQTSEPVYQPYGNIQASTNQSLLTDTLTKAIAADPNFQSVLATAISSMVGNSTSGKDRSHSRGESFGQNLKWVEAIPASSNNTPTQKGNGCASSYLTLSASSTSQTGNLLPLPPPLPYSMSKNSSGPTADNRDN